MLNSLKISKTLPRGKIISCWESYFSPLRSVYCYPSVFSAQFYIAAKGTPARFTFAKPVNPPANFTAYILHFYGRIKQIEFSAKKSLMIIFLSLIVKLPAKAINIISLQGTNNDKKIAFAGFNDNFLPLKCNPAVINCITKSLITLFSLKHLLIISNLSGYIVKLLKFLLIFNDYTCIACSLNRVKGDFCCKFTYLITNSGNIASVNRNKYYLFALLILLFSSFTGSIFAQNIKTNLEIFEQEISSELEKVYYLPQVNRELKFVFWVSSVKNIKEEKKFIEQVVKRSADKNKLKFAFAKNDSISSPEPGYIKFSITIEKLYTVYSRLIKNKFLGDKSMQREIYSVLDLKVSDEQDKVLVDDDIKTKFDDEIPYDDYTKYESSEYKFTQSSRPDISFIESIIFPAAVVTVSAIAAVLFFTIRSK